MIAPGREGHPVVGLEAWRRGRTSPAAVA